MEEIYEVLGHFTPNCNIKGNLKNVLRRASSNVKFPLSWFMCDYAVARISLSCHRMSVFFYVYTYRYHLKQEYIYQIQTHPSRVIILIMQMEKDYQRKNNIKLSLGNNNKALGNPFLIIYISSQIINIIWQPKWC